MPIDPSLLNFLADPRNTVRRPPPHVPLAKVRAAADTAMMPREVLPIERVQDLLAPNGALAVPFRLYSPTVHPSLPFIVYVHGGGFVWGSIATHEAICRRIARATGAAVASVAYRLAPETQFPGPVHDVHAVTRHLVREAPRLGLDPARPALCGDSAGGNIALAATGLAISDGIRPRHLVLIYPAVDPTCSSSSHRSLAEGPVLTRDAMLWFWSCYLGTPGDDEEPVLAPLMPDLRNFPPVTVVTAEYDPLRDEGEDLAARVKEAGVEVALTRYEGTVHGFLSLPVSTAAVDDCYRQISERLVKSFNG